MSARRPNLNSICLLGYLVREEPAAWILFTSEWRIQRIERAKHSRLETSDVNAEIETALEFAALVRGNRERGRSCEVPQTLRDSHNHFHRLELLFDLAYLAFVAGRNEEI